jgi:hypothetical protein
MSRVLTPLAIQMALLLGVLPSLWGLQTTQPSLLHSRLEQVKRRSVLQVKTENGTRVRGTFADLDEKQLRLMNMTVDSLRFRWVRSQTSGLEVAPCFQAWWSAGAPASPEDCCSDSWCSPMWKATGGVERPPAGIRAARRRGGCGGGRRCGSGHPALAPGLPLTMSLGSEYHGRIQP